MNGNDRYQQRPNGNRYQYQQQSQGNQYQQNNPYSEKARLEGERRALLRQLTALDGKIDGLGAKGTALDAARAEHMKSLPATALGVTGVVALNALGLRFVPSPARAWYDKYLMYQRSEEALKSFTVKLWNERQILVSQIEHIDLEIDMLQYQP